MRIENISGHKLEIYDSIDELPIKRFHKLNKYALVDSGVGSDFESIDSHLVKILKYIEKEDGLNAKLETMNLRQCLFQMSSEVNINHLSFLILIKSIDGKDVHDISDEGLRKLQKKLENEKVGLFRSIFETVKKKIDEELKLYFPSQFDDARVKEYYERLRARLLLQLDELIRDNNNDEKLNKIDDFLLSLTRPKVFFGKESAEIAYDKQFEDMNLFLSRELKVDADKMNVLQYYNSLEFLKKQQKDGRKSN